MSEKEDLLSIVSDLSEVAVDSVLKDGLLKDIPVFGIGFSVANLILSASDKILLNKLLRFLKELGFRSQKEIEIFKEKYFKDKDYKHIGAQLLYIIERSDDEEKIKLLAKLLRLFIDQSIDKMEYLRLASIVNNSFPYDLYQIRVFKKYPEITSQNKNIETYILDHLFSIGLLESHGTDSGGVSEDSDSGTIYALNKFGTIILEKVL